MTKETLIPLAVLAVLLGTAFYFNYHTASPVTMEQASWTAPATQTDQAATPTTEATPSTNYDETKIEITTPEAPATEAQPSDATQSQDEEGDQQ